MFKKNKHHLQPVLICSVNELPEEQRDYLNTSWSGVFYREFFSRLDEEAFAVLYSDLPSRPNIPVNVLVGLEYLKAGFGWSDEEMYEAFLYNLQVRYALGYDEFGKGHFDLRTLYYFRERLSRYMQEHGVNLLDRAFEQVTDEQLTAFQLKTGIQRMDSTMVGSNIRLVGRLQLLVEVLQRMQRMLSADDCAHYSEAFAPYLRGHAGQYVLHLKREEFPRHIQRIGEFMQLLLSELKERYNQDPVYQVLERVFSEHFKLVGKTAKAKTGRELSATSLQSPDDLEATFRHKSGKGYRGYVANLTETCDPQNTLQLITKVQVAPNTTADSHLLAEALPNLKQRMGLDKLYTDAGHGGKEADVVLQEQQVTQIQTAIRGHAPNDKKLSLSDFVIKLNEKGKPVQVASALLMLWARLSFGRRSFHATADATEGGLVTKGPYKYLRHPIYAAILYFLWAGVFSHLGVINGLLGVLTTIGLVARMVAEERKMVERYPEYTEYATHTKRIIPFIL